MTPGIEIAEFHSHVGNGNSMAEHIRKLERCLVIHHSGGQSLKVEHYFCSKVEKGKPPDQLMG